MTASINARAWLAAKASETLSGIAIQRKSSVAFGQTRRLLRNESFVGLETLQLAPRKIRESDLKAAFNGLRRALFG